MHDFQSNIIINTETLTEGATKVYATYKDKNAEWYMGGTGDDKNGVWLALQLLEKLEKVKVILTVSEEIGLIGAMGIDQTFLTDIGYYIEGDRKGDGDIITDYYGESMISGEFRAIIYEIGLEYGYSHAIGSFTDICELYQMNEVSAINISVGYYNAHQDTEFTIYEELVNAKEYALNLIESLGNEKYGVTVEKIDKYSYYNDAYDFENYFNDSYPFVEKEDLCEVHIDEIHQDLIDLDCTKCNPKIKEKSALYCGCGQELHKRFYSYYCPVCGTHKLDKYEN